MNPSTLSHPRFGVLTLNSLLNWYESKRYEPEIGWFTLCIDLNDDGTLAEILVRAELAYEVAKRHYGESSSYAASKLTGEYNEGWNEDVPITEDEFSSRIKLSSLVLHYGLADFYFDDGGLFAGHAIHVEMEEAGKECSWLVWIDFSLSGQVEVGRFDPLKVVIGEGCDGML